MKKITELSEVRWRTTHLLDEYGNRHRQQDEYIAKRPVRTISSGPRFGHYLIDLLAFQVVIYLVDHIFTLTSANDYITLTEALFQSILMLVLYPVFYAFCERQWQSTPGKLLTKTLVIDEYGNKPKLSTLILRSLLRLVPFESFSCFGDHSRGWHDEWSKTWVVSNNVLNTIRQLQNEQSEDADANSR